MKLTKKLETEILKSYNAYWNSYLKGDMKTFATLLDDDCHIIGSTEFDVFKDKKSAVDFYTSTADQITSKADFRNRKITVMPSGENVMVEEFCDFYFLANDEWKFYGHCRLSTLFSEKETGWKIIYQHGSMPDSKAQEGEQIAAKEVAEENKKLRNAIKRRTVELETKNRELEIETALERVRTVAMAMRTADDLLEICKIVYSELLSLGFNELRNVMINIHNDDKASLLNYDYSDNFGKTITDIPYNFHALVEKQVAVTKNAQDAFFEFSFEGEELKQFRELRKSNGEQDDPKLEITDALHYYFFSIGTGSIGISTYSVIQLRKLELLKRFRNVFNLSYQRYTDISKAEAQAREAKIEVAMERTRTQSMIMQHSDELNDTLRIFHEQVLQLNIPSAFSFLWLPDEEKNKHIFWAIWEENKNDSIAFKDKAINYPLDRNEHDTAQCLIDWKSGEPVFSYAVQPGDVEKYFSTWQELIDGVEKLKPDFFPDGLYYVEAFMKYGCFGVMVENDLSEDEKKILYRFAIEFERTYTRFLDLQKAEAQAREAEIELGLERVRARAMAMQHSDELSDLVDIVFKELTKLDFALSWCMINIIDERSMSNTVWGANPEIGKAPESYHMLFEDYRFHHGMFKAWKEKQSNWVFVLKGSEKKIYDEYLFNQTEFRRVPKPVQKQMRATKQYVASFTFSNFGGLQTVGDEALPEESLDILQRFGKVFDLTYTRFNDLQKAEAQAREAEIELSLERVRARTMAMQHSDELLGTSKVVFDQLKNLGETANQLSIGIINEKDGVFDVFATIFGNQMIQVYHPKIDDPFVMGKVYKAWKEHQKSFVIKIKGKRLREYNITRNSIVKGMKVYPESIQPDDSWVVSCATFSAGIIAFSSDKETSNESIQLLERFAKVFEQTYTRFLDLQKAETQAREAEIELALERVRARTLAMQYSEELQDAAIILFQQLKNLNVETGSCGFNIWDKSEKQTMVWMSSHEGGMQLPFRLPHTQSEIYKKALAAKEAGADFFVKEVKGNALKKHFDYLSALPGIGDVINKLRKINYAFPEKMIYHFAFFKQGYLSFHTHETVPEVHDIFKRFAKVFEQTYTRFLDLQKAEAQARESQIQLALERVRARTMAMQKSEELSDAVYILFQQFKELGENPDQATIGVVNEDEKVIEYWVTMHGNPINKVFKFPIDEPNVTNKIYNAWKENKKSLVIDLSGSALREFMAYRAVKGGAAINPKEKRRIINVAFFSKGLLNVQSNEERSEESIKLLERFASVFEQTYTRFLDLQKAEAQARESKIELSLERVRAKTMAMHNSQDVGDTVATMFAEFVHLGIQTNRCGILIFNNEPNAEVWTAKSNPEGKANLIIGKLDMNVHALLYGILKAREKKATSYTYLMEGDDLINYYQALNNLEYYPVKFDMNALPSKEFHSDFYFQEGSVFTFTDEPIPNEASKVIKRFAAVFGQTYRRYLDLQKAEAQAREAQIEAALEKVRSRSMGMQKSEELKEVIKVVYEQFVHLNINVEHTGFIMDYKERDDMHIWLADQHLVPSEVFIPYFDSAHWNSFREAKEKGTDFFATLLDFEEKNKFYKDLFALIPGIPEETLEYYFSCTGLAGSTVLLENVALYIENFQGIPYTDDENNTLMRFGKVFQQTYTRFLDLQKAEAQAKEAQIENALEKVRSRSLGMHKSDELREVVKVVFEKLQELDFAIDGAAFIGTLIENSKDVNIWIGDKHAEYPSCFRTPVYDVPTVMDVLKAHESGLDFFSKTYSFEEKNKWFQYAFQHTDYKMLPEKLKNWVLEQECLTQSFAWAKNSGVGIHFHSQRTLSEAEIDILKRFSKVFEQGYVRFLDLQKSEAQAREAEIELALERIRARTMAMQHSDELADASLLLDQQIRGLGIKTRGCAFNIYGEKESTEWFSNEMGTMQTYKTPREKIFLNYYEAGQKGETLLIKEFSGKECVDWYNYLCTLPVIGDGLKEMIANGGSFPTRQIDHVSFFKYGYLLFITFEPVREAHDIFIRFAKVFEQTYTRFLDLQKAEAQAREAQIEAALERVRARTMAMQRSDELPEAANLLFQQVQALGMPAWSAGYCIWDDDKKAITLWMSSEGVLQPSFRAPLIEDPSFINMREAYERGESFHVEAVGGDELVQHYKYMRTLPVVGKVLDSIIEAGHPLPTFQIFHCVYFSQGFLLFITYEPVPAAHDIFKRFGKVFDQTYTRFLDLKKAEAQAREAKIEAALERVRGRAMAMHSSRDLAETIKVFYHEMELLSVTPRRCGVGLIDKETHNVEISTMNTTEQGNSIEVIGKLKLVGHPVLEGIYDNWLLNKEYHPVLRGNEIKEYYQLLRPQISYPDYLHDVVQYGYFFYFPEGGVYAWTNKELEEDELKIYRRFTTVLSLTYKRYKDLTDAEARAKEAIKQASLDRVRGEIASMRSTEDLQRITPLIFKELTTLGVPFFRCGVFIINELEKIVHIYLSAPDGHSLAVLNLSFESNELTANSVKYWREGKVYRQHWSKEEFINWTKSMMEMGQVRSSEAYQGSAAPPEALDLHFVPFSQGMLYVGNSIQLNESEIDLVKSLAEAFSIAYARYEDFTKLEHAKQIVENALSELKAAQKQLVQSEKMASLGELTAGIAHEIQNPLNFVNNFSEVNKELLVEMKEEINKGNLDDANAIANDVIDNSEKINHHGKRAGDIVKGMLQHSRSSTGVKEPTDINALADEYLRLSYHGLRAKDKSFNATMKTDFDESIGKINIIPQDIGRVLLNLFNNAFYAVNEQISKNLISYEPTVSVTTKKSDNHVIITVSDNGNGIPQKIVDKIFQPFFTTKPTGQGTGLGLSLSYDIMKAHGGEIKVESKEARPPARLSDSDGDDPVGRGEETTFIIQLPFG